MPGNMNAVLNSTITVTDTTITPNAQIITRSQNQPTLAAASVLYEPFLIVGTAPITLQLPTSTIFVAYVKNLHTTANILVAWTPNGGANSSICVLAPGGVLTYFQSTETFGTAISSIVNGLLSLSLQASAASIPCEVMVAA